MLLGLQFFCFGSFVFDFVAMPIVNALIVPVLIFLGVMLFAWEWLKPLMSAVVSKAKSIVPNLGNRVAPSTPTQTTTSERVVLWEQLYEACEPCPKARELLDQVFQHLAPCHTEKTK